MYDLTVLSLNIWCLKQSFGAARFPAARFRLRPFKNKTAPAPAPAPATYVQKRKTKHKHTYIQTIHTNEATTRINQNKHFNFFHPKNNFNNKD